MDSDPIATLIRAAGERPAVSEERHARVLAEAQGEWQKLLARRAARRRTRTWLAAAAVVLAGLAGTWIWRSLGGAQDAPIARVELSAGGSGLPAAGQPLLPGTEIRTGDGRLAIRLANGQAVRFDVDTTAVLTAEAGLSLERGALYLDNDGSRGGAVEVTTPSGRVYDIGTRYAVRVADGELRVVVRDGLVQVVRSGETIDAPAGYETRIDASGTVTRRGVTGWDKAWAWTQQIAPVFEIEGRPFDEFLTWAAKETGRRLAYDGPGTAERAAEIRLSGSVEGLTPEEALAAIVPASGFEYRVRDDGLLVVREVDEDDR